ncbi:MAG: DUF3793 family protein [Oscillospiraceae bacterium]|nr:DUF3793 family protein [Oscillospiraceae bacterium]
MSEEQLVRHCSPTLAGLKTGSLFGCRFDSPEALRCDVCALNRMLSDKGLRVLPLQYRSGRALIYVFRPERLRRELGDEAHSRLLERMGYPCAAPMGKCLSRLMERLRETEEFPHEIGLFLGYPPEDVQGFIEKRACKITGYWKVYGDTGRALQTFASYRRCTDIYLKKWKSGASLRRLAVRTAS